MNLIQGGQGRDENDMEAAAVGVTVAGTIFALAAALLVVSLCGCESSTPLMRGQVFDDPRQHQDAPGDALPAPLTAQERVERQYIKGRPIDEPRLTQEQYKKFVENLNSF